MARPVAAALGIALLVPAAVGPPTAHAGSGCTNHDSKKAPPSTIRVYRVSRDRVDTVDFRRYVGIVMASGEWPTWLPQAVLQAGATATKQYAWYYTLEGHHRSSYVTDEGVCYDVRDDTNDQLYRPQTAEVRGNQLVAIEATWALTLRKRDRFFLTGYRAGTESQCAADADGWKLYAKSMVDCAEQGWDRQRIQERYYRPNITFVWGGDGSSGEVRSDRVAPTVTSPVPSFKLGRTLGRGITLIDWSGADKGSGVARYKLQVQTNGGPWTRVRRPNGDGSQVRLGLRPRATHRFRVRAFDQAGNASAWNLGPSFRRTRFEDKSAAVSFGDGAWATSRTKGATAGSTRFTTDKGARASFAFTGRAVALVAPRGPGLGAARVRLDGVVIDTIDLHAGRARPRKIVFSRTFGKHGRHTIEIIAAGTNGRPRVDVDAFLVMGPG